MKADHWNNTFAKKYRVPSNPFRVQFRQKNLKKVSEPMFDMLQVLSPLRNELKSKNYRRFSLIVVAVLSMVGRVTMLGISRWTDKGGSSTVQSNVFSMMIQFIGIS
ncbi:MAG: hypothetical protein Q9M28_03475 [Mariprofundaceae bacterium]|nr:hypothetical protein [Mariprofundaceae bacterium]